MASSKDRERELARQRYQRQLERRAANKAKARQRAAIFTTVGAIVTIIVIVAVIAAVNGGGKKSSTTSAGAQPSATGAAASGAAASGAAASSAPASGAAASADASGAVSASTTAAAAVANPTGTPNDGLKCTTPPAKPAKPLSFKSEPPVTIDTTASYVATITTNCGVIKADLYASKAPHTVNSFAFLAGKGYFTDVPCHRLTTSGIYVLQCGDPTGTGSGGPGYSFKDENLTGATYGAGVLAMANSGANTNGSQFFINYKASTLPPSYTPFGMVTQGLDIVNEIAARGAAGGSGDGAPVQPVSILSFTVTKS